MGVSDTSRAEREPDEARDGAEAPSRAGEDRSGLRARRDDVASARDAIAVGEASRMRIVAGAMLAWCVGGALVVSVLPGAPLARATGYLSTAALAIGFVAIFVLAGRGALRDGAGMVGLAVFLAAGAVGMGYALGVFSAFLGLIAIGLTVFAFSAPPRPTFAAALTLAIGYLLLALPVHLGVLPDVGLFVQAPDSALARIVLIVGTELGLLTAYGVGRLARRKHGRVVEELEAVVRRAARREALLREAQEELARADGVGETGRFTEQELEGFRLGRVLGRGGMGEVYEATGPEGEAAAVKLLRRDVLGDGDMVRRFAREALAVAAVDSPHVVEVLAVGGEDAPLPFIAMERLEGEDLASRLRSVGRLPLREVVELVEQVAAGLGAAHEAGVVHRDLKPHNLFRTGGAEGAAPVWKILDFGVSKIAGSETLTRDGLVGTPGYMAPEQVDGGPVDRRADLHALSCIAYRALTGEPPFGGGEMARVLREIAEGMPRDPRALAGVSEEVTRALRVGLAKEPADRYPDAATLAEAFRDAARGELDARWRQRADALDARRPWQPAEASDVEVTRVVRGASTGR